MPSYSFHEVIATWLPKLQTVPEIYRPVSPQEHRHKNLQQRTKQNPAEYKRIMYCDQVGFILDMEVCFIV